MKSCKMFHPLAILTIFLSLSFPTNATQESVVLPTLDNVPRVGVKTMALLDKTRLDPFTNNTRHREVMVSLFYRIDADPSSLIMNQQMVMDPTSSLTPYMPPATAAIYNEAFAEYGVPNGTFEHISTRCTAKAPFPYSRSHPLIIFSPGGGNSRLLHTATLEELARTGYLVAAIDHPYDALVVEFPDGRLIKAQNQDLDMELIDLLVTTRAQDLSFVLDELSSLSAAHDLPIIINTTHVVAFGHSLGGAAAAEATLNDSRIVGGINFDGRLFGSLEKANITLSKPFLQFGSVAIGGNPIGHWDEAWKRFLGWKMEVRLEGSQHATFTDMPLLAEAIGLREKLGKAGEALLGSVDGLRGMESMVAYVGAFAEFVLQGKEGSLLDEGGNEVFPEVKVTRHV